MSDERFNRSIDVPSLIKQGVLNYIKDLHTCLPGKIVEFDPQTQTAKVQPMIRRVFKGKEPEDLPVIPKVPVHFSKSGGFAITSPVKRGDECLIIFCERSIDNWYFEGKPKEPNDLRFHDITDAFCIVGISSKPNVISNFDNENFQIRNLEKDVTISITPQKKVEISTPKTTFTMDDSSDTITVSTGTEVKIQSPTITVDASSKINFNTPTANFSGDVNISGESSASDHISDGISGKDHIHGGVSSGSAKTLKPE